VSKQKKTHAHAHKILMKRRNRAAALCWAAVAAVAAALLQHARPAAGYTVTIAPVAPGPAAADPRDPTDRVACATTTGEFTVRVHHGWAPHGARRFVALVRAGYFTDIGLFRRNHWIVQFGAVATEVSRDARWRAMTRHGNIPDDPDTDCFGRCRKGRLFDGALSYAGGGPNTRAAQMFVVHHQGHQPIGHEPWEVPFAEVEGDGLDRVVRKWYAGYGEGVDQGTIMQKGNAWLRARYPKLDYIKSCRVLPRPTASGGGGGDGVGGDVAAAATSTAAATGTTMAAAAAVAAKPAAAVSAPRREAEGLRRAPAAATQELAAAAAAATAAMTAAPPPPPPGRTSTATACVIAVLPLLATAAVVQLVRLSPACRSFF